MESLEQDLETAKAMTVHNAEVLAKSLEERRALEGELDQMRNVAQLIISEVFGSAPSTSAPTIGWQRFQMRFGPSSSMSYSTERRGC